MSTKRILSLVLALVMVLGTFGTVFAAEPTGNTKVDWLAEQGYVLGDAGGFRLEDGITRAEVSVIVAKALGLETEAAAMANIPSKFSDMRTAGYAWANGFVNVLTAKGYISGYPDGTFGPAKDITYAEVASMLVRVMGGLTEAEAKTAVWPTTYLAKAASLGIFADVTGVDYSAKAVRGKIFEMVYNTMMNNEIGGYSIVKGIVLDNNRVESIGADQIVVEVIQEIQRAEFVKESRDIKGDQIKLTVPAKIGDVENLLGKVANFSIDKDGKVAKVEIDNTYEYVSGSLTAIENALKVGTKEYTVIKDERVDRRDDRIFRTYLNNKSNRYANFAKAEKYTDADVTEADYARVTIKNGKVLFIDAFNFDDIAPVKEVKKDGAEVYVYNDARDNAVKKFDLKASTNVLAIKDGVISKVTMGDIAANDVIHAFAGGYIVRKDAVVTGEFAKVSEDRYGDFYVHIDDEPIYIPVSANKKAVYSYDSKDFYTLEARFADSSLKEFRKQNVTALLDLSDNLQYIGSEIELGEFVALVARVSGNDLRVVKADNTKVDLRATLNTKYNNSTGHFNLNTLEIGDLVYLSVDGEVIERIVNLTEAGSSVTALDARNITVAGDNSRILGSTNVFVSPDLETRTVKDVVDAFKKDSSDVRAYVISGEEFSDVSRRAHAYTQRADEAHTIVFTKIKIDSDLKSRIVEFDGFADRQEKEMKIILEDGTKETRMVYVAKANMPTLKGGDIIEIKETKNDKKDIEAVTVLITANADRNVFEVTSYDRSGNITLRDKTGAGSGLLYTTSDTVVFGNIQLANAKKVSYVLEKNAAGNYTQYVKAVLVRRDTAAVTGLLGADKVVLDGQVTAIAPIAGTDRIIIEITDGINVAKHEVRGFAREFVAANSLVRVNDEVKVILDANKDVVGFSYIKLSSARTIPALTVPAAWEGFVLDGGVATGRRGLNNTNVFTVDADNATIKNIVFNGDVTVSSRVENDFTANNVEVQGITTIAGGSSDTVKFTDSKLKIVNVTKKAVRIKLTNTPIVTLDVSATTGVKVEKDAASTIANPIIGTPELANPTLAVSVANATYADNKINVAFKVEKHTDLGTGKVAITDLLTKGDVTVKVEYAGTTATVTAGAMTAVNEATGEYDYTFIPTATQLTAMKGNVVKVTVTVTYNDLVDGKLEGNVVTTDLLD